MRKIIAYEFLSADGYFAGPPGHEMDWVIDRFSPEMTEDIARQYEELDAFIMGRTTFESLAGYWPTRTLAEEPLADYMNSIEKLVCSTSSDSIEVWQPSRLLQSDFVAELRDLKAQDAGDYMVIGSGSIVRQLTDARLVDEFRFLLFPVVLGAGKRLFDGITGERALATNRVHRFDNGVLALDFIVK